MDIKEWVKDWDDRSRRIAEDLTEMLERATTPSELLPLVSKGLALAAKNYVVVCESDSSGGEEIKRALSALEDAARNYVATELRVAAEQCGDARSGHADTLENAAAMIHAISDFACAGRLAT